MQNELLILLAGIEQEPWKSRTQECWDTWAGLFKRLGYTVKAFTMKPDLETDYKLEGDVLWVKAEVDVYQGGTTRLLNSFKWVLEQTSFTHALLVDNDTFVHPQRFIKAFLECKEKYKDNFDYWGCCHPIRGDLGFEIGTNTQHIVHQGMSFNFAPWNGDKRVYERPYKEHFANGAGYVLSRKAMECVLRETKIKDHYGDLALEGCSFEACNDRVVGRSLTIFSGIRLIHDGRIVAYSPSQREGWIDDGVIEVEHFPYIGEGWANGDEIILQHYVGNKYKDERFHMKNIMKHLDL